jgi:hypothetical protein
MQDPQLLSAQDLIIDKCYKFHDPKTGNTRVLGKLTGWAQTNNKLFRDNLAFNHEYLTDVTDVKVAMDSANKNPGVNIYDFKTDHKTSLTVPMFSEVTDINDRTCTTNEIPHHTSSFNPNIMLGGKRKNKKRKSRKVKKNRRKSTRRR